MADKPSPVHLALHADELILAQPGRALVRGVDDLKLRRGTHTSVRGLNADIRAWIQTWNDNPRPYIFWTKTADQILASIGNYCTQINNFATLVCLVQSDDPSLQLAPVGATEAQWNREEWLNRNRGI